MTGAALECGGTTPLSDSATCRADNTFGLSHAPEKRRRAAAVQSSLVLSFLRDWDIFPATIPNAEDAGLFSVALKG